MTGLTRSILRSVLVAAPLALLACSDPAPPAQTPAAAPAPKEAPAAADKAPAADADKAEGGATAEAEQIYVQRCVTCHGATGVGDGPASAALDPKPQNFQNAEWQKEVTDEELTKVIVEGGPAVGKSVLMPGNPDLADKPEVVAALVQYIRELKK